MTAKDKISSVTPAHGEPPATTREICAAAQRRFGRLSTGATSDHDLTYAKLKALESDGAVERHGGGRGPAIKWNRTHQSS